MTIRRCNQYPPSPKRFAAATVSFAVIGTHILCNSTSINIGLLAVSGTEFLLSFIYLLFFFMGHISRDNQCSKLVFCQANLGIHYILQVSMAKLCGSNAVHRKTEIPKLGEVRILSHEIISILWVLKKNIYIKW